MKAESRRQKAEGRIRRRCGKVIPFCLLPFAFCLLPSSAFANDLLVDPRTLQLNDLTTITVSLEGSFASAESVHIPLDNLALVGEPWVSSEFAWINGEVVRRKVLRYRARPLLPGVARVGPLVLTSDDGQRDTLPAIALQVMPDRIAATNDPEALLRELTATGRPVLFLVAEADKREVWAGERVVVTWYLYNGTRVENWQIVAVPKLADFWSEEIDARSSEIERVYIGDRILQRALLRRVALFPLRSGTLQVGGMSVEASLMERLRTGPFSSLEGNVIEITFTSAPLAILAKALPPGPAVAAVGEAMLTCEPPKQKNGGPVVVEATIESTGNVRGAPAPRFGGRVAGEVEIEGGGATISRHADAIAITRRWRYLIFPAREGALRIPPLTMTVFSPSAGQRRELRCEAQTLFTAVVASGTSRSPSPRAAGRGDSTKVWPWVPIGVLALIALIVVIAAPRVRREVAIRRQVREILRSDDIRREVDARLGADPAMLLAELSDRGDAYRSLRSLLDAIERDRDAGVDVRKELTRRVREVLR